MENDATPGTQDQSTGSPAQETGNSPSGQQVPPQVTSQPPAPDPARRKEILRYETQIRGLTEQLNEYNQIKQQLDELKKDKQQFESDPLSYIKAKKGKSELETTANRLLTDFAEDIGAPKREITVEEKLAALEKRLAEKDQAEQARQELEKKNYAEAQARHQHQQNLAICENAIDKFADKAPLLKALGDEGKEAVLEAFKLWWNEGQNSRVTQTAEHWEMFVEDAEAAMYEQYSPLLDNLSKVSKFDKYFKANEPPKSPSASLAGSTPGSATDDQAPVDPEDVNAWADRLLDKMKKEKRSA